MKKIVIALSVLVAISLSQCLAEELTNQTVANQNSYLGLNIEKKPIQDTGKQQVKNDHSFLFINIVINGKAPYDKTNDR